MMKLVLIGLALIAFPLITGWLENRDPDYYAVIRMADRDRKAQAARKPTRALNKYAAIGKQKSPGKRWHAAQGQSIKTNNRISRKLGFVK